MEKLVINGGNHSHNQLWFLVLVSFVFCLVLLCFDFSVLPGSNNGVSLMIHSFSDAFNTQKTSQQLVSVAAIDKPREVITAPPNPILISNLTDKHAQDQDKDDHDVSDDPCSGKYIYVHHLPSRFNNDIIKDCQKLVKWFDMCPSLMNSGLGPKVEKSQDVLSDKNWFETNQFLLELIFHHRFKQYKCLTNDSSMASAVFVPYYAGLDIGRYLWGYNTSVRDSLAYELVDWLRKKDEWNRMFGRDHFFVAGRIAWDFRRQSESGSADWGSRLMTLPESMNMTMLSIETTSWSNEFAVPYPTYFHPSTDSDVIGWQKRIRSRKRRHLFSFAGAPRPSMEDSIRGEIINQCSSASKQNCKFLDCNTVGNKCDNPVEVIKVFRDSKFCLQPPGDSYSRRSTFDSVLAGCIPVFFHPYSAYAQYIWYFPKNYTKYSVYIPANDIKHGNVSIDKALSRYSNEQVSAMRKEVIKLIPKVIYTNPMSRLQRFEDAFDIAVKRVLERVKKVRELINQGEDPAVAFAAGNSWKLKLSGIVGDPPLEQFF